MGRWFGSMWSGYRGKAFIMCGGHGCSVAVFSLTVSDSISSLGTWSSVSEPKALDQSEFPAALGSLWGGLPIAVGLRTSISIPPSNICLLVLLRGFQY